MLNDLYTPRGESLTGTPWQVYPRPQLRRSHWCNLNGFWDFTVTDSDTLPQTYDRKIQVPFCPESLLSGIHTHFPEDSRLYYRRELSVNDLPEGYRVLLHIGAADQITDIYINQSHVGSHTGGYDAFTVDITTVLREKNQLVIRIRDDLRSHVLPYGKQTMHRGGMWYTPVSGIWQTVWLEYVPQTYVQALAIQVTQAQATITVTPALSGHILLDGKTYPLKEGVAQIAPKSPRLWTPEDPYLYHFTLHTESDQVESYFALRTLQVQTIDGIPRLCLNGQPYFFHGLLDQGYWSDGIYTPAAPECFTDDILAMKQLGFNTLRKHIKVEPEQFYYDCDRLGMIVFQDMVNNGDYSFFRDTVLPTLGVQLNDKTLHRDEATRKAFLAGMESTVKQLKNHPCIACWTIFNEGWGQFCGADAYKRLKQLDDTRFIDTTSGWFRCEQSDVESLHIYFDLWGKLKPSKKPLVLSEFGGYCYPVEGHLFHPEKAYGYRSCKTHPIFLESLEQLYRRRILPAISKGLCAAIYTQVSDVEDEINGLLTYDRKVNKADPASMLALAEELWQAIYP